MTIRDMLPENVMLTRDAYVDLSEMYGSVKSMVVKGLIKVAEDPRPNTEGGRGVPLGVVHGIDLSGYCKIKWKAIGLRCVYECVYRVSGNEMRVIAIGKRENWEVYRAAKKRIGRQ